MAKDLIEQEEDGQTPLEDFSGLIPNIEKTRQALYSLEYKNINKARVKYLLKESVKTLTISFLSQVHKDMLGEVWEWAGKIREERMNLGIEPHQIRTELGQLIKEIDIWENKKIPAIEIAVRIHHRLAWIHPFNNGNGRFARLICDIYLRSKGQSIIEWPTNPELRPKYLSALKEADGGDFTSILELSKKYWNINIQKS